MKRSVADNEYFLGSLAIENRPQADFLQEPPLSEADAGVPPRFKCALKEICDLARFNQISLIQKNSSRIDALKESRLAGPAQGQRPGYPYPFSGA